MQRPQEHSKSIIDPRSIVRAPNSTSFPFLFLPFLSFSFLVLPLPSFSMSFLFLFLPFPYFRFLPRASEPPNLQASKKASAGHAKRLQSGHPPGKGRVGTTQGRKVEVRRRSAEGKRSFTGSACSAEVDRFCWIGSLGGPLGVPKSSKF